MLGVLRALRDVCSRGVGKLRVPDQDLSAVELTPVPVGPHYGADEVGVVLVGSVIRSEVAGLDIVGGSSDCGGRGKSEE